MFSLLPAYKHWFFALLGCFLLHVPCSAQPGPDAWADYLNHGAQEINRWQVYLHSYNHCLVEAFDGRKSPSFENLKAVPAPGAIKKAHQLRDSLYQLATGYAPPSLVFSDWEEWSRQVYAVEVKIEETSEALLRYRHTEAWRQDTGFVVAFQHLKSLGVLYADYAALQDRMAFMLDSWSSMVSQEGSRENPLWVPGHTVSRWMESGRTLLRGVLASDPSAVKRALEEIRLEMQASDDRRFQWVKEVRSIDTPSGEDPLALYEMARTATLRLSAFGEEYLQAPASLPAYGETGKACFFFHERLLEPFSGQPNGLVAVYNRFRLVGNLPIPPGITEASRFCPVIRLKKEEEKPVATAPKLPLDIVFVVDISGSMGQPEKVPLFRQALAYWLTQLPVDTRVSLVTFSGSAKTLARLMPVSNKAELIRLVQNLGPEGQSLPIEGIKLAYEEAAMQDSARLKQLVVVTDGGFEIDQPLLQIVESQGFAGVPLHAFYFGSYPEQAQKRLSRFAEVGKGGFFAVRADNFDQALRFLTNRGE